jgi:hypothetical protein
VPYDVKYGNVTLERGTTVDEDEVVVVFRAQDNLLLTMLGIYRQLCEIAGSPYGHIEMIERAARAVGDWQEVNRTKTPDSDPA